jgi:selenocysteine lyase/cysteine desulfurase
MVCPLQMLADILSHFPIGSFGSVPRLVMDAAHQISERIESNPDLFYRVHLIESMKNVRLRLAKFINAADVDELVLVPNATHGVNTVLHNFHWKEDDILIECEVFSFVLLFVN